jgi:2-succinyl-6-hydroxy-2,4-cyclohexadiene-1-carboxylate synthase
MTTDDAGLTPTDGLHAVRHPARARPASRLVLVHGFTQTGACWAPVVARLDGNHELLVVDAPGHGGSDDVRTDLWAGADRLVATGGRAVYVGYSMGGRLALHAALGHPEAVEGLVLVGATAGIDDPAERARRRADDERLADHLEAIGVERFVDEWLARPLFAGLRPEVACRSARLTNTVEGLASSLRLAGTGSQDDLWLRLHELGPLPVLVVAGADDEKYAESGRRLAAGIGPTAAFVAVPRAGHSVHLEQPAAFVDVVERWLRALALGGSGRGQAESHRPPASSPP